MKLADVIQDISPVLSTAISSVSPLAGVALSLVSSMFGGSQNPDEILANLSKDPNAAVKLKQVETQYLIKIQELASQNYAKEVDDREDARDYAVKMGKEYQWFINSLAIVVTVGFFGIMLLLFFSHSDLDDNLQHILFTFFGVLTSKWQTMIDYFYGSSKQ